MAKTKKKQVEGESKDLLSTIKSSINEQMNRTVAYNMKEDDPLQVKQWFSTGSTLVDLIMRGKLGKEGNRGGVPSGRITLFNGEHGSGKSLFAWHVIKDVVDKGGVAIYIDTEGATNIEFAEMIGVNLSKVVFIPDINTLEETFRIIEIFLNNFAASGNSDLFGCIVVDSITALTTEEEDSDDFGGRQYPTKARLMSKGMRKLQVAVSKFNLSLLLLNQLRKDINANSFLGDGFIVPTGVAQGFHSSTSLRLYKSTKMKEGTGGDIIGQTIRVKTEKTRFTRPLLEVKVPLHFEYGIQDDISVFEFLVKAKIIASAGSYKKIPDWEGKEGCNDKGILQFRGSEWPELYRENKDLKEWVLNQLSEILGRPAEEWYPSIDKLKEVEVEDIDEK
jgi:recombination protein RecA